MGVENLLRLDVLGEKKDLMFLFGVYVKRVGGPTLCCLTPPSTSGNSEAICFDWPAAMVTDSETMPLFPRSIPSGLRVETF